MDELLKNTKINKIKKFNHLYIKEIKNELNKIIINEEPEILEKSQKEDIIKWDYNYSDIFKCRIDNINKINVYYISSFISDNEESFLEAIFKCALLFDNNNYPISLISTLNDGGYILLSNILLESFSPLITHQVYLALRKTNYLIKIAKSDNSNFENVNCEKKTFSEFIDKFENKIDYGMVLLIN